jgi:hypothetical protein
MTDTQPEELPIIFRAERTKDGDVTAVFPTVPSDVAGRYFTVYAHIGQHSGGSFEWYNKTCAAKPAEYADLLDELRRIYERSHAPGDPVFRLKVYRRMTPQHRAAFRAEARRHLVPA